VKLALFSGSGYDAVAGFRESDNKRSGYAKTGNCSIS
jgi:hypothetical protein